jgi:hypothetical protein
MCPDFHLRRSAAAPRREGMAIRKSALQSINVQQPQQSEKA